MTITLDVIIRQLEGDNPPNVFVDPEPAMLQREQEKPFVQKVLEPIKPDIEVEHDYINTESKPAYPTLSKILGKEIK